jgi:regulator of sirC expression with transglutaminase-like and TPR domain
MKPPIPLCANPIAFGLMAQQFKVLKSSQSLFHAAVAISLQHDEKLDPDSIDETLQNYADIIRSRVRGPQPQALLAHLHEFLFEEEGFAGNHEEYYIPSNSLISEVLRTKKGLPITLSLIYKLICDKLGIPCEGVGLPGHFIVAVQLDGKTMYVDPFFEGVVLSPADAQMRMLETIGEDAEWTDDYLQPISHQQWITRMLQNLLHVYASMSEFSQLAAILELEIAIWPEQPRLQKDLAQVLARLGMSQPASAWLSSYLRANPNDPDKGYLEQLLAVLSG